MALHVEVRFLLAGKAGIRKIFCGCAAPDRNIHEINMPITQPVIGLYDGLFEILLETGRQHGLMDLSPADGDCPGRACPAHGVSV